MDRIQPPDLHGNELASVDGAMLDRPGDERHRLFVQTLNEAQVDFLLQRTPAHEIKTRQGRGGMVFSYVEHGYVTERLNLVFGFNWDLEVIDKQILEDEVIVEAKLTVRTPGGQTIVKSQFGGAEIKRHASGPRSGRPLSIADDYKAAASDALKKCASLLGIGLDLYGRDRPDEDASASRSSAVAGPRPGRPGQREVEPTPLPVQSNGCTRSQQREIADLAAAAGMDLPGLSRSLGVSSVAELTQDRAERVIRRLRDLSAGADTPAAS